MLVQRLALVAFALLVCLPAAADHDVFVTVDVSPRPAFCNGEPITLTATATGGDGNYSYQWFNYEGDVEGLTSPIVVLTEPGNALGVRVTDGTGDSYSTGRFYFYDQTVSAEMTTSPLCLNYWATAEVAEAVYGATYEWSLTNATLVSSNGRWINFFIDASPVTIGVTVTSPGGCTASSSITQVVGEQPSVTIVPQGPTTFCAPGSVTLTANATGANSYSWSTGETTQSIVASAPGWYSVQVSGGDGSCWASDSIQVNAIRTEAVLTGGGGMICAGASSDLTVHLNGVAPWTVTWADGVVQTTSYEWLVRTVTPSTTTTYSLASVTDASGCAGTATGSTTVTITPPPTATVSGDNQICPGGSAPLQVSLTGNAPWTVRWSDGYVQTSHQPFFVRSVSPSATTTYTITNVSSNNCASGTASGSATITVARPSATVSGGGAVCPSAPATISATLTGKAPWYVTWSDGPTIQYNSPNVTRTVIAKGTYTITSVSDANCLGTSSGSAVVTNFTSPSAHVTGSATICPTSTANLTVTLTGTAPWTVGWSDGVTETYSASPATRAVSAAATYTLTSVADVNGCTGSTTGSAIIQHYAMPSVTITGVTDPVICDWQTSSDILFTFGAWGTYTVRWSDGAVETYHGDSGRRSITPGVTTTYSITSVSNGSCSAPGTGSATIERLPTPTATVTGGGAFCGSGSAEVTVHFTGVAPFTVVWPDGQSMVYQASSATRAFAITSSQNFTVTGFQDANCPGTVSGVASFTVEPVPAATVSGGGAICPGGSANVTATLTGTAPWSVTWNDGLVQSNITTSTITRSVSTAGTYFITAVSGASCSGTSSGSASVSIRETPAAAVSGSQTICAGSSATISASLTGTGPWSITWSDGVTTSHASSPATRTVSAAGTYSITAISDAYCSGSASGSATITHRTTPVITTHPLTQTIRKNTSVTLTVAATSDTPVSYQWYRGESGNTSTPVGTNSPSYTTPKLASQTSYWVRVTNACGPTNSNTAVISVR